MHRALARHNHDVTFDLSCTAYRLLSLPSKVKTRPVGYRTLPVNVCAWKTSSRVIGTNVPLVHYGFVNRPPGFDPSMRIPKRTEQSQSAHPRRLAFYRAQLFDAGTRRVVSPPNIRAEDMGARHEVEPTSRHGYNYSRGHPLGEPSSERNDIPGQATRFLSITVCPPLRCSLGNAALTHSQLWMLQHLQEPSPWDLTHSLNTTNG